MKTKKFFQTNFDPTMQPGHQTRNKSLQSFYGVSIDSEECPDGAIFHERGLREKFKSNQVSELLPSRFLRKQGKV